MLLSYLKAEGVGEFVISQVSSASEAENLLFETIVFADIKGFTRITQHLSPKEGIRVLNSIFEIATQIVYENGGDVDKYYLS